MKKNFEITCVNCVQRHQGLRLTANGMEIKALGKRCGNITNQNVSITLSEPIESISNVFSKISIEVNTSQDFIISAHSYIYSNRGGLVFREPDF